MGPDRGLHKLREVCSLVGRTEFFICYYYEAMKIFQVISLKREYNSLEADIFNMHVAAVEYVISSQILILHKSQTVFK